MFEQAVTVAGCVASAVATVVGMGVVAVAGAWLLTRREPCNPYAVGGDLCCDDCGGGRRG